MVLPAEVFEDAGAVAGDLSEEMEEDEANVGGEYGKEDKRRIEAELLSRSEQQAGCGEDLGDGDNACEGVGQTVRDRLIVHAGGEVVQTEELVEAGIHEQ